MTEAYTIGVCEPYGENTGLFVKFFYSGPPSQVNLPNLPPGQTREQNNTLPDAPRGFTHRGKFFYV